jgi:hypothetical protein
LDASEPRTGGVLDGPSVAPRGAAHILKLDSDALATLLRLNSILESYAPPPEVRAQRNIVRERVFYRRKAASVKNHIYSVLLRRGIMYEDRIPVPGFTRWG